MSCLNLSTEFLKKMKFNLMEISSHLQLNYKDVVLIHGKSSVSSRSECDITAKLGRHTFATPLVCANMKSLLTFHQCRLFDENGWFYVYPRTYDTLEVVEFLEYAESVDYKFNVISISVGITEDWVKLVKDIKKSNYRVDFFTVDVAFSYTDSVLQVIEVIKKEYPNAFLIVGNGASPEWISWLESNEVDCAKINIGVSCFVAGTRVLMSDGTYKNIEDINVNDSVISGTGKPTKVTGVRLSGYKSVMRYYHPRFYKPTECTHDHLHFVNDSGALKRGTLLGGNRAKLAENREYAYCWKSANSLSKLDTLLIPKNIEFELSDDFSFYISDFVDSNRTVYYNSEEIHPSYELGYIIGAFVGDGCASTTTSFRKSNSADRKDSISTSHNCEFYFGPDELDIATKLNDCVYKVFGVSGKLTVPGTRAYASNLHQVSYYFCGLSKFLQKFYNSNKEKTIPNSFFVNHKEYLNGILDGFYDSDGCEKNRGRSYVNTSPELLERIIISCYLAKGFFPSISQAKKKHVGNLKDGRVIEPKKDSYTLYYGKNYEKNYFNSDFFTFSVLDINHFSNENLNVPVYDIEVECASSSFIANNVIVHNSSCRTKEFTGFSSPPLGNLIECAAAAKNISIMADGGLTVDDDGNVWIGDIAKAIRFGANFVMSGSIFAGCLDTPSYIKGYFGNSTEQAKGHSRHVEGACLSIKKDYTVRQMMSLVEDSLKSSISYAGGRDLSALKTVDFIDLRR